MQLVKDTINTLYDEKEPPTDEEIAELVKDAYVNTLQAKLKLKSKPTVYPPLSRYGDDMVNEIQIFVTNGQIKLNYCCTLILCK